MKIGDVKTMVIWGAGRMGAGIAEICARAGYQVVLRDISEKALQTGLEAIKGSMKKAVERGKMASKDMEEALSRVRGTLEVKDAVKDADVVIECTPEDLDLKKKVFKELDEACPERTVFASNTSSLMITDLASVTKRQDKFIGMHFFNPVPIMRLVEVVRGALTSDETVNLIKDLSVKLGKIPVVVNDGPGFFTSRWFAMWAAEAFRLFELGIAGIKEIDTMCKLGFNMPLGPFELHDMVGIDVQLHVLEYLYKETGDPRYAPPTILKKLVKAGYRGDPRFNPGSKGGFYDYFKVPKDQYYMRRIE